MKLRQKLAMVLATAMVVTAVPVTTMAASSNEFNKTLSIVADEAITTNQGLTLKIDYAVKDQDKVTANGDVFFINATDFEFEKEAYDHKADGKDVDGSTKYKLNADGSFELDGKGNKVLAWPEGVTITYLKAGQIKVEIAKDTTIDDTTIIEIPIAGTPKKGNPAIAVDGDDSYVTSGKYALSGEVVTDKLLVASLDGDATNISIDGVGTLGKIKIEETVANGLDKRVVLIELDRKSDLVFDAKYATAQTVEFDGDRGLAGVAEEVKAQFFKDKDGEVDKSILEVTFPEFASKTRGAVSLKDIAVEAEDSRDGADVGEVEVTVSEKAEEVVMEEVDLVVANVSDFGLTLKAVKEVEFVSGKEAKEVEISLKENASGSINDRRDIFFEIEGAVIDEETGNIATYDDGSILSYDEGDNEFRLTFGDKFDDEVINEFKFKVEMHTKPDFEGDVEIVATSRDFDDELTAVIGTAEKSSNIDADQLTVKVGLTGQVGGEIRIEETEAETFERGEIIKVVLSEEAEEDGIDIEAFEFEVEGDIELEKVTLKNDEGKTLANVMGLKVTRESDEASTIIINEIEVDVNRLTPEGNYDVTVGGDAISDFAETVKVEDFIKVGTKNTEDIQDASKVKEVILAIDSVDYTVDGEAKVGAAAPYIEAGRTMIPLRLVSEEFGALVDFNTLNGVGTVTIQKEGTTIQLQNGTNILNKNGILIPMDAKTVIKDGTTFVPFRYLATALNITDFSYDQATNTVTFKN